MSRRLGYATVAVLGAVLRGQRYGLEIMDATGFPSGTVYPTLTRLEGRGFVTGHWEPQAIADRDQRPRRRYYRITRAGRAALADAAELYGMLGLPALPPLGEEP
jgi:PadR family transcriptional regulator PadR